MDYQEFEDQLLDILRKDNEDSQVITRTVIRNNGIERRAVNIIREGDACSPNIYLEPVYKNFCRCRLTVGQAVDYVMRRHERMLEELADGCRLEQRIGQYEWVRERLTVRMVNREKNQFLLSENTVSFPFLDLAGVLYVSESLDRMDAVLKVTEELMDLWGVRPEELKETALRNLAKSGGFRLRDICEVIEEAGYRNNREKREDREPLMYVLTDLSMKNGPAAMLLPDILQKSSELLQDDLLLLPSSVHELIVLRATGADYRELKRIVREINDTVVDPEEILSDSVYKYSREQSEVTIAA